MIEDIRPNPDSLLEAIQRQERSQQPGQLKVFLGMAAGVGKTFAMLEAAQKQFANQVDVVIGYVETHGRKETDALLKGLPAIPRKNVEHRSLTLGEMDLEALLARKPKLALVDELAHSNAPGSRHLKRYQDVLELLDAGIDVYTTLNVQHVESRAQTVEEITGSTIHETVPDRILDIAEIELIDISPDDLMRRLDEGKIYLPDRAAVAMVNFFREGNLTALREMALRLAAERVGQDVRDYLQVMQIQEPWKTGHRLLVAVSASPYSAQMVRWTRRLADSLDARWLAVHVEPVRPLRDADQRRLTRNLALARELGAEIMTTADHDLMRGIVRTARQHNITQIVVGKPTRVGFISRIKADRFLRRLVAESGAIDVHIVRANKAEKTEPASRRTFAPLDWNQYATSLGAVALVTLLNTLLYRMIGSRAIGLDYLLTIVVLALFLGRGPVLFGATASALLWDYFFLSPRFTFTISSFDDAMMFATFFVVATVMGQLIARFREQEKAERRREERTTSLYHLTRELVNAATVEEAGLIIVTHLGKLMEADVVILLKSGSGQLNPQPLAGSTFVLSEKEFSVANWVFEHNRAAGKFTDNLSLSDGWYLPMTSGAAALGVIGLRPRSSAHPTLEQQYLLEAMVQQAALVLDRQRLRETGQQTRLAAESERLSKTLLDSISHEMRTPIAVITSAAATLSDDPLQRQEMVKEIKEAVERLNRLVGNILDMNRVESGQIKAKLDWCDVTDLVNVTVGQLKKELAAHPLKINLARELPLAKLDFVLAEQALANLLLNAANHTPDGTAIELSVRVENDELIFLVADSGPGIAPTALPRIFEKFYRAPGAATGGTGLGLSIVKGFVEAQNGRVQAFNQATGGAAFLLAFPVSEAPAMMPEINQHE